MTVHFKERDLNVINFVKDVFFNVASLNIIHASVFEITLMYYTQIDSTSEYKIRTRSSLVSHKLLHVCFPVFLCAAKRIVA
jgi:hypothetical protein